VKRISYAVLKPVARKNKSVVLSAAKSRRMRRLLSLARPYWGKLAITLFLTSITSTMALLYPALAGDIIDSITVDKNIVALRDIIFLILGLAITQAVLSYWQYFWLSAIEERVVVDLRIKLYSHLQKLPLGFFQENRTGELLSRLTNDVTLVRDGATNNLTSFIQNLLTLVIGLVIVIVGPNTLLAHTNLLNIQLPVTHSSTSTGQVTLWLLLLVPLFIIPYLVSSTFFRRIYKKELAVLSEATSASEESLSNAKVVKAFTREEYETQRYKALAWQQFAITRQRVKSLSLVKATSALLGFAGMAGFLWYAGTAVLSGSLTIGTLTMTIVYLFFLMQPLTSASSLYNQFQMSLGAADRIFDLLDHPVTLADRPGALPLPTIKGDLQFEQVTFSYDDEHTILHDVSFKTQAGQVLALVGPSGAGKTTIANLIPRFFDIQSGRIMLDGHDISQVQLKSLREQIGIVLQEPVLFGTSVRDNIAYGRPDATQNEIEVVARVANAHMFIQDLPEGYDTLVGERGVKLSVGQRQRIAIARALLCNPRILILDEATSSLDNESESLVQEALERLMHERTTIIIAHRLTTIQHADRIVVMEHGRVIEQGNHEELLDQHGMYYRLYTRNFQPELA
jgi:ATP-binding cassette, subfamily B, bacterial MsbA